MNTMQNYVGKGNFANGRPQMAKTGLRPSTQAESRPTLLSLVDTLVLLRGWADQSIQYVKRRNHLSEEEKTQVYRRLEKYKNHIMAQIRSYLDGTFDYTLDALAAIPSKIDGHLREQAKLNGFARYYEFPIYTLPDSFLPERPFDCTMFLVETNMYRNSLFRGDHLMCQPVPFVADLKPRDFIVVTVRRDYRRPRVFNMGWFVGVKNNELILEYTSPDLQIKHPRCSISMFDVVHFSKLIYFSRDLK